jgi:hypothetical protein
MAKAYRIIEVGLTRWQWQVLKAAARAFRDKDVEAHAANLLYAEIVSLAMEPVGEFEESFPVPALPSWRWEWTAMRVICPAWRKGTGVCDAFDWHPRRWWVAGAFRFGRARRQRL